MSRLKKILDSEGGNSTTDKHLIFHQTNKLSSNHSCIEEEILDMGGGAGPENQDLRDSLLKLDDSDFDHEEEEQGVNNLWKDPRVQKLFQQEYKKLIDE